MRATEYNGVYNRLERLDRYLAEQESQVIHLRRDCEKKIVWCNGIRRQRELAIVYIHGFSASRKETWPLCDRLARLVNANLFYTRLAGHGQDGEAMGEARVSDWLNDGMEAVSIGRMLGKRIILVGTSTGGTLVTWLSSLGKVSPVLAGVILISPNFFPLNPMATAALWPPGLSFFERLLGGWRCFTISNAIQANYWTVRYPLRSIRTMMQLVCLSWRVNLRGVTAPVLMLVNPFDRVVNVLLARIRFSGFGSSAKRVIWFTANKDPGRHVLAGSLMAPEGTDKALTIIHRFLTRFVLD